MKYFTTVPKNGYTVRRGQENYANKEIKKLFPKLSGRLVFLDCKDLSRKINDIIIKSGISCEVTHILKSKKCLTVYIDYSDNPADMLLPDPDGNEFTLSFELKINGIIDDCREIP